MVVVRSHTPTVLGDASLEMGKNGDLWKYKSRIRNLVIEKQSPITQHSFNYLNVCVYVYVYI